MKKNLAIIALSILTFWGCKKNQPAENTATPAPTALHTIDTKLDNRPYLVSLETAQLLAERLTYDVFMNQNFVGTVRTIESSFSFPDKNGSPALHVFNYRDGGYAVISADFRFQPVCVFAETGKMAPTSQVPATLGLWYSNTVQHVEALRDGIYDNGVIGLQQWTGYSSTMGINDHTGYNGSVLYPNDPGSGPYSGGGAGCGSTTITTKSPLLATIWGQGVGYNNKCPDLNCTTTNGPHALTGCVATAMAQVIRYWQPSNTFYRTYNYASMLNNVQTSNMNTPAAEQVQYLMQDCGNSMGMSWGCDASGADGGFFQFILDNSRVPNRLHSLWGMSSGGVTDDYNNAVNDRWIIVNDLAVNRPVILTGGATMHRFMGIEWTDDNHMWVCDGYRRERNNCSDEVYFHMNWGWYGLYNDWYYQSNWDWAPLVSQGDYFPYLNNVIHNIHN